MQLGIILGTNRNLTSLTAALLALHPNCQVLNHGFKVFKKHNFITDPDQRDAFCEAAIATSSQMIVGPQGGSIMASHAVRRHVNMKAAQSHSE